MNNLFKSVVSLISGVALLASCNPKEPVKPLGKTVSTDVAELSFEAKATSAQQINVVSDGAWIVVSSAEWLEVSPLLGEGNATLTVKAADNFDEEGKLKAPRSAKITITCSTEKGGSAVVVAKQVGDPALDRSRTYNKVAEGVKAGKAYLIVAFDGEAHQAATPIAAGKTYGYLSPNFVEPNEENAIELDSPDYGFIFEEVEGGYAIRQPDGRYLIMTGSYNSFNVADSYEEGGIWTVEPATEGTFTIKNASTNKYIQYSTNYKSYGSYSDEQGVLPLLFEDTKEAVIDDSKLYAENASVEVLATATSASFSIVSNLEWTVTAGEGSEWATLKTTSGSNDGTVEVEFSANEGDTRTAVFTVASVDGKKSCELTLTQLGNSSVVDATAAEINAAEDGDQVYRITGYVSSIKNTTYGNLYIKDYTGEVYVYGTNDFASTGIEAGDIITVIGPKTSYKESPQMKNVTLEKRVAVSEVSVADFRAAAENKEDYYCLSGKVVKSTEENTKFDLETYGNFAVEDETGSVYVYGVVSGWGGPKKEFGTLGVKEGDTITIVGYRTSYNGLIQMGGAFYVSHEAGQDPDPDPDPIPDPEPTPDPVTIENGPYWLSVNGKVALPLTKGYGYLNVEDAVDGASYAKNAFTFTSKGEGKYTIQDAEGQYYYHNPSYKSFNRNATLDESSQDYLWAITKNASEEYVFTNVGTASVIAFDTQYSSFGVYPVAELEGKLNPSLVAATNPIKEVATITVAASLSVKEGDTANIEATSNSSSTITYVSADPTIASVSDAGVVTGVKAGSTTITVSVAADATYAAASKEVAVTVIAAGSTEPVVLYTLDTTKEENKGTNNGYATNGDVTCDGITWNVTGNLTMLPWRIGGKSLTNEDREIYTKTAFSKALTTVAVTFGTADDITVNSCKLLYSTNADFTNAQTIDATFAANSTVNFAAEFPANCYYKLVLNVTVTQAKNKFVQLSKIEFLGAAE